MLIDAFTTPHFVPEGAAMLILDQFSECVLFQCDRCQMVGELFTTIVEDDERYYCWRCLSVNRQLEMNRTKQRANSSL